jgi:hypothetical protein
MIDTFQGLFDNEKTCSCGSHSHKFDTFMDLQLEMDGNDEAGSILSLTDMLRHYAAECPLEGYECPICKSRTTNKTTKTMISKFPDVFSIRINHH